MVKVYLELELAKLPNLYLQLELQSHEPSLTSLCSEEVVVHGNVGVMIPIVSHSKLMGQLDQ